jgi:hypothetical protein
MARPSKPLTEARAALALALDKHGVHQQDIAALMCCNQGRISETVTGQRFPGIKPADLSSLRTKAFLGSLLAQTVLRLSKEVGPIIEGEE